VAKLTRKQAKARTRIKLIDGLIEIVRAEGLAALTTSRVAERAGVSQSSFYVHFKDMNDALQAAAIQIGGPVREAMNRERESLDVANPREAIRRITDTAVSGMLAERAFAELFLALRRDPGSPLGQSFRALLDQIRGDLMADLDRFGLTEERIPSRTVYTEVIIGQTLAVVEGLLDGRLDDKARAIDTLVDISVLVATSWVVPQRSS
jgi:AcrR family transcriptional regulator